MLRLSNQLEHRHVGEIMSPYLDTKFTTVHLLLNYVVRLRSAALPASPRDVAGAVAVRLGVKVTVTDVRSTRQVQTPEILQ